MTALAVALMLPFAVAWCPGSAPFIVVGAMVLAQIERSAMQ